MYKIMTPGPTQVAENVLQARSLPFTNPDLDEDFFDFYKGTCQLISQLLNTEHETVILGGEGILALEASCASLTEPGDRALVLDNGIFGRGFADFVTMYGGEATLYAADYKKPLSPEALGQYLQKNHDFKYATLVHCDTPSGILNPVDRLCPLLKKYGILTVVDSVSAMFGEMFHADGADLLCGGSQKAVSAPPGLAFVTISPAAKDAMRRRKTPIASFYANLQAFEGYYEKKWFPYTMPISDIHGLRAALENIRADGGMLARHARIAHACRHALTAAGLSLHAEGGYSSTVTVFDVPEGLTAAAILEGMKRDHNIMLAGSFDQLEGQVIRIGHMGANANVEDMTETMEALGAVLESLGMEAAAFMGEAFAKALC